MYFSNESEAFLALISLAISADQVTTTPEQRYLFEKVGKLEPFRDLSLESFKEMMSHVNAQLFSRTDAFDSLMQNDGIAQFCDALKGVVPASQIGPMFQMACEIAYTDGLITVERSLLDALGDELGLSTELVRTIMHSAEASYS